MSNYFRITAYDPKHNKTIIVDSNGYFDKLWKLSSLFVINGFQVVDVCDGDKIIDVNLDRIKPNNSKIVCVAIDKGRPVQKYHTIGSVTYPAVQVGNKTYAVNK